jgi:D-aminoacyl-tRNA deacylase
MAQHLSQKMRRNGSVLSGSDYDLTEIPTPAISADWLEQEYRYDGYVFLSKHAASSGVLALTCHSTGNFAHAAFGGGDRQVAVPYPDLQKRYLRLLKARQEDFADFQITIEATHHGPTALSKPSLFIEVGTTQAQWDDGDLCGRVAEVVDEAMRQDPGRHPVGICFGGTHYPHAFTQELLYGEFALGTVVPRRDLGHLDCLFIEVGTTQAQWDDGDLCGRVAEVVDEAMRQDPGRHPVGICFGGTHYPHAFTQELLYGEFALGTVVPRRDLGHLDCDLFSHILERNAGATAALLDWKGLGPHKQKVLDLVAGTDLEVIRL